MKTIKKLLKHPGYPHSNCFVGPRIPSVGFWFDKTFLGEAKLQVSEPYKIEATRKKVAWYLDMLEHGVNRNLRMNMLNSIHCHAVIYR